MKKIHAGLLLGICFLSTMVTILGTLQLNSVMKIADSFAYLQMAHHFSELLKD